MKENYTYPVILERDGDFVNIRIPAFDAVSCVEAGEDPIPAAQDLLTLEILSREEDGEPLPEAEAITPDSPGQSVAYVSPITVPRSRKPMSKRHRQSPYSLTCWRKREKLTFPRR